MDRENYEDPTIFKPWRFSDMREEDGESTKHHFVSTSSSYMAFGHGKHAWYDMFPTSQQSMDSLLWMYPYSPGRFFAVNELKTMMVHILLNYDMKFENGTHSPENLWHAISIMPDPNVKILFRKRRN